jgi:hypothetical protein
MRCCRSATAISKHINEMLILIRFDNFFDDYLDLVNIEGINGDLKSFQIACNVSKKIYIFPVIDEICHTQEPL